MFTVIKTAWGYQPGYVYHEGDSQWWYDYKVGSFETYEDAEKMYDSIALDENTCSKKVIRVINGHMVATLKSTERGS